MCHAPRGPRSPNGLLHSLLRAWLWVALLAMGGTALAQTAPWPGSNLRQRWIHPTGDSLQLDTRSIVPGSLVLRVDSAVVDPEAYTLDPFRAVMAWPQAPDSAWAEYRVHEGAILQIHHRISTPEALAWTEQTRHMYHGLYRDYALGRLEDRCFAIPTDP